VEVQTWNQYHVHILFALIVFVQSSKNTRRCDICNWPILQYELDDIMMHANDDYARSLWYGHSGDESWEPPEDPKWTPEELQGIMNKKLKSKEKNRFCQRKNLQGLSLRSPIHIIKFIF
jgi:hypothetical protein